LEAALVRQIRAAADGAAVDVVVGVTPPASGFSAHAGLTGTRSTPSSPSFGGARRRLGRLATSRLFIR
jgi:hypothetical protein